MRTLKLVLGIFCLVAALPPGGLALVAFFYIVHSFERSVDVTGVCLALFLAGLAGGLIYTGRFLITRRNLPISLRARVRLLLFFSGIGILVVVGLPNFINARSTSCCNACVNNLRQIDAAAQQFALEYAKKSGDPINYPNDLTPYIKLNTNGNIPPCPQGGTYSIKRVGDNPTCSLGTTVTPAHVLP